MSAILECSFPAGARKAQQPVGGRTTDLDPGLGSSLPATDDLFAGGRSSALWPRVAAPLPSFSPGLYALHETALVSSLTGTMEVAATTFW
jgi:hypothetical protein